MPRATLLIAIPLLLAGSAVPAQSSQGEGHYEVDLSQSDVHWLVYKAGSLARFGHNHVISVSELAGDVYVAPDLADSRFEIRIPYSGLVVDNPALRAEQGEQFASVPSAEDVEGTRRNMLSGKVLDAEHYDAVQITGTGPVGAQGSEQLHLTVQLLGRSVELTVPTQVTIEGDTLRASGHFELTHEALGMKPFSVMLGALQVADPMDFSYRVTAHRAE